jgi:hypothetical protein
MEACRRSQQEKKRRKCEGSEGEKVVVFFLGIAS